MVRAVLVLTCLWAGCGRKIWQAPNPQDHAAALAALVDALPAATAATVKAQTPKGEWVHAIGTAGSGATPQRPVDRYDRFSVRDITAAYVTTAILILADENSLRLDDPVSKFVSGIPRGDEITLRHLAGMRSGLADYAASAQFQARLQSDPTRAATPFELLAYVDPTLHFDPGTAYEFSRTNPLVLGEVIRNATGKAWADYVEERLLQPLKLFAPSCPPAITRASPTPPASTPRSARSPPRTPRSLTPPAVSPPRSTS
jgi:D-alanyl-D-alanine carboxypeptidase